VKGVPAMFVPDQPELESKSEAIQFAKSPNYFLCSPRNRNFAMGQSKQIAFIRNVRRVSEVAMLGVLFLLSALFIAAVILHLSLDDTEFMAEVVIFFVTLGVIYDMLRLRIYDLRLSQEGKIIKGRLTTVSGEWSELENSRNLYLVHLIYRFTDTTGKRRLETVSIIRNDLRNKKLPRPGTPIAVIYLDEKHYEVL
jgi:hypothetical protein